MIFSLILIYLILASFAVLSKLADATNQFPQFDQRQPDADKVHAVTRIKTRPHEWQIGTNSNTASQGTRVTDRLATNFFK